MKVGLNVTRLWLCAVLICVGVAGCGQSSPGADIDYHNPLGAKLTDLSQNGRSARLSDLTDFSWNEVHLFRGLTREKIAEVVGSPAIRNADYDPEVNLLVFEESGNVVKVIGLHGLLSADHPSWPSTVRLEPSGNGLLRLTLPSPDPPN
ncbi:hypothetical protein [Mycolicibacterium sp. XJ870]